MKKETSIGTKITILLSIFFTSVSLFVYQVVLTRIYSAVLSYHFVFLITSFAILGSGIGSVIAYKYKKAKREDVINTEGSSSLNVDGITNQIKKLSITLALCYFVIFTILYLMPFTNNMIVYIILGTIPFIFGGILFSLLFTEYSLISGKLYFADLIGSGIGSVFVILLLNSAGMFRSVLMISLIALIPTFFLPSNTKKIKFIGLILPSLFIIGLLLPNQYINTIEINYKGILENNNKTFGDLKAKGASPKIVYSDWNAFSRTDVIEYSDEEAMVVTIDGSANAPMYKFDGNIDSLDKYKKEIGYLPFAVGENSKTLLIGPGGGSDVLYALAGGSEDIDAVEINTSSIDAVQAFGDFNGNVYDRPEVKVYGEDGRSFVKNSKEKYDVIFLSLVMTSTSQGLGYSLSENYIYTVEAMRDYLEHLNDNGKIAFLTHDGEDFSKIIATAVKSLVDRGVPLKETPNYIAAFSNIMLSGHGNGIQMHSPVILIKNSPYSEEESRELMKQAEVSGVTTIHAPHASEGGPLKLIREGQASLIDYIEATNVNISPATDNKPYFYNFNKGVPSILIFVLVLVTVACIILFIPFALKDKNLKSTTYFGLLGIGYMMIEVPLIQKFILYLGHPTLAFSFVLAALLIGSGIGGFLSSKNIFNKTKVFYLPPIMVALINIALLLSLEFIFNSTSSLALPGKILLASILVMIQGFFMGMPFPRGIKLLGESGKDQIVPIMWGVNGVASVIGSVLSTVLSMLIGFTGALALGAAVYLIISLYREL